jgi:thiol-disulfide isomerase/thioredoxin
MGKASRNKRAGSARDKIAAQRAAARRAEVRNRVLMASGAVVVVIAIVVTFVLVQANKKPAASTGTATGTVLSAQTLNNIATVPASTLNSVGAGTSNPSTIIKIPGTSLTSKGKPEVLYIGAEYCPYCAAERWALAVALSRFGTFAGLHGIHSSTKPGEPYPATPTLTFYKSTYTSNYLTFTPVETLTVQEATLQHTTAQQNQLLGKYDAPPYVSGQAGAIPFVDFGGHYIVSGASYSPQVLANLTWSQIAAALHDPSSAIAKGVDGTANRITAAICKLTGNQPASACTPVVKALEARL